MPTEEGPETVNDRQLQKLLDRATAASEKHARLNAEAREALTARYGIDVGEVDCDPVIDALDYGLGRITVAECDKAMEDCGHPPLPAVKS